MSVSVSQTLVTKLDKLLSTPTLSKQLIGEAREIFQHDDIRILGVKAMEDLLQLKKKNKVTLSEIYQVNILKIVGIIADEATRSNLEHEGNPENTTPTPPLYDEFKKHFSNLWTEIMKWDKTQLVHRKILILLPEKVLMHLRKPLHMSDYMLSAFDLGGPLSLLALQSIFVLMTRFNFEVADFYTRLYSMFTPSIFHAKYRARFFGYASDFLASTHLPEYLVAAFVKKLSRLSLTAPTPCLPMIFDFITNIMIRHSGLKKMIHKENGPETYDSDPFLNDETDPIKTKAIDSLLWEIKTHQNHVLPSIANHAKFMEQTLPKVEKDLDQTLNYTCDDVFNQEMKRKRTTRVVKITDEPPRKLVHFN